MRVIPVIDLLGGVVVRGIAGRREAYKPIEGQLATGSQPATIARAFAAGFGFDTAYVADLDAIQQRLLSPSVWQHVADAGLKLWLDAGIGDAATARIVAGAVEQASIDARLVVGLESLQSASELQTIRAASGSRLPIFSLDLKAGQPLTQISEWFDRTPLEIAQEAIAAGYRDLIVLDLADVGTHSGTRTVELCQKIRSLDIAALNLIAGGGVRSLADLQALRAAGCDAALVASALHDKRLTPADIRQFTN